MGIFNFWQKTKIQQKEISFNPSKEYFLDILSSNPIKISAQDNFILDSYFNTPQLSSIINNSAKVFSRNDLRFYTNSDIEQENEILSMLENPHPLYSEGEFWDTFSKQFDLFNIVLVYKVKGIGTKVSGLFVLPYHLMKIVAVKELKPIDIFLAKDLKEIISHYELTYKSNKWKIETDDVWMITGSSLRFEDDKYLIPDSIIENLRYPIKNIQANYEARYSLVENRGALGIWVNQNSNEYGSIPVTDNDKNTIYDTFRKRFGLTKGREIVGITDANIKFESASIPLKNLELSQGIRDDKIALCDAYNYPILLMNELEGSTFSNMESAERLLYTNKIIPFWELVAKSMTKEFLDNGYLEFYIGDIESLKKDDKVQAETNTINVSIIINLNKSVSTGEMSRDNAIQTLINIADIDEQIANELIMEYIEPTQTIEPTQNGQGNEQL